MLILTIVLCLNTLDHSESVQTQGFTGIRRLLKEFGKTL